MDQATELIVSVSGIRGIVGQSLTAETATAFAAALSTYLQGGPVVLSQDGRPTGKMLRHAVLAGLLSAGCRVYDLGIASTPTCGFAVRRLKAAGGIQITASHNPAPWNGLKLFGPDGRVLAAVEGKKVQRLFEAKNFRRVAWNDLGEVIEQPDAAAWHRDRVLELVDVPRIRSWAMGTFLDANGGAGGPLGRNLLHALGTHGVRLGDEADGLFRHEPEPVAEHLRDICPLIPRNGADIGFVLDPDADRLAIIDETGRYIGEELTLALAVLFRLRQERGPVVINMSTSRVVEEIARGLNCPCHRSAVGEANVADKMREVGAIFGGEGNGGVIDPRVGYVRDPFIGMGLILNLLAETGQKLSALVDALPRYTIVKDKFSVNREQLLALYKKLEARWPDAAVNRTDGLRLDFDCGWIHVRSSNTEPIVRVIGEAKDAREARQLCDEVGAMVKASQKSV